MTRTIEINMKDVEECAASGWSIRDTAEELGVSHMTVWRFVKQHGIEGLFGLPSSASDPDKAALLHTVTDAH